MAADERQLRTPLFDALVGVAESHKLSFHTPGHKSGKGISHRFTKFVGHQIFAIDLTTLDEVDSLQRPTGVIREAQALAAEAYGSDRAFFLVNGTTVGNHAMVMTVCGPDDPVLVARNAHRSVLAGCILAGARPVFFPVAASPELSIALNATFDDARQAIDAHPEARALVLTSPNYYGVCADLARIVPYAHERGVTVLVDEAHGPHLHFHPELPLSALDAGADLVVQSTHKIIGGMTQASMLHARGPRVETEVLAQVLTLLQSTSPSYVLMASLDLARMQMATEGKKLLRRTLGLAREARERVNRVPGLSAFGPAELAGFAGGGLDETKVTVRVADLGLSGYQASQLLNQLHDIHVEMADPFNVLAIVSIGDRHDDIERLTAALADLATRRRAGGEVGPPAWLPHVRPPEPAAATLTPREAFFRRDRRVLLAEAAGSVSSEIVTVYPPGIPILVPGEMITPAIRDYLEQMALLGATVDGLTGAGSELGIRVID